MKITRGQFLNFKKLKESGLYNMIDPNIRRILDITKEQHRYILENYEHLEEVFSD